MALREWPNIARGLDMPEYEIIAIRENHPRDIKQQCHEAIITWWKLNNTMDTSRKLRRITQVLIQEDLRDVAGIKK